ncbi:hypothetical protein Bhyg_06268 [Pseudolycoriella hygida]|uniref:Uncharacterized protein n=1 Tax=Pseudolycoriella hygida TaxID=35572 RepID=A0A9Q0N0B4_9DIPT|nr:hypothetical protein Bhyg_06268 [Pseudolycoriella hygida]
MDILPITTGRCTLHMETMQHMAITDITTKGTTIRLIFTTIYMSTDHYFSIRQFGKPHHYDKLHALVQLRLSHQKAYRFFIKFFYHLAINQLSFAIVPPPIILD